MGGGADFSASAGMNEFENNIASTNSRRFMYKSFCLSYKGQFIDPALSGVPYPPTEHFAAAVAKLLKNPKMATEFSLWEPLFSAYGTHFTHEIDFGGKMLYEQTITERSQQKIKESGLSVAASAEASYNGGVASVSAKVAASVDTSEGSEEGTSSSEFDVKIYVFGGVPPGAGANTDAGFAEWSNTVHDMPMPVRYELTPLYMMSDFTAVEKGTQIAEQMTSRYYLKNVVDPTQTKANTSPGAKKLKQLPVGTKLTFKDGNCMESDNGDVKLDVNEIGELQLLYKGSTKLWSSHTFSEETQAPFALGLSGNGHLTLKDKDDNLVWEPETGGGDCIADYLKIEDNGNLMIQMANGKGLWSTGTKGYKSRASYSEGNGFSPLFVLKNLITRSPFDILGVYKMTGIDGWGLTGTCDEIDERFTKTTGNGEAQLSFKIDLEKAIELENAYPCQLVPVFSKDICAEFFD